MATTNKIKCISNVNYTGSLAIGNIYTILAETETQYSIVDDVLNTALYPKTLFKYHYEISKLESLLPDIGVANGAEGIDSYGNHFRIISNDSNGLRLNSLDKDVIITINIPFTDEYGGVAFTLAQLLSYGFSIVYTQDVAKSFVDRDLFIETWAMPNSVKYNETYDGIITLISATNTTIIPNLIGLELNF